MARVNGAHELAGGGIFLAEKIIEEEAIVGDELAPWAVAGELGRQRSI